jgi:hypothetical protein
MKLSLPLLLLLVAAAIVAGLVIGAAAGRRVDKPADRKTIGARVRTAATDGFVRLWKWNRDRKKKQDDRQPR